MGTFKCIRCGNTLESTRPVDCRDCGYPMFEVPYVRKDIMICEIREAVKSMELKEIIIGDSSFYRSTLKSNRKKDGKIEYEIVTKAQDDQRFPDFEKIHHYVHSADKTELFFERLNTSLDNIRAYTSTCYEQSYNVSMSTLERRLRQMDTSLKNALRKMGIECKIADFEPVEITLRYSETPRGELANIISEMLDALQQLSQKMERFIRQNNIYGLPYRDLPKAKFKRDSEHSDEEILSYYREKLEKVLQKQYLIDILSDGIKQFREMLSVLWHCVAAILSVSVFEKKYVYAFPDGSFAINEQVNDKLFGTFRNRYTDVDVVLSDDEFLRDRSEDALFELYEQIVIDGKRLADRTSQMGASERKLDQLIGLSSIKESIRKIKAYAVSNKDSDALNLHMCFYGNPGTGKTEVARIIAGIFYENKILPNNYVIEVDRSGLVSQYLGETPQKTMGKIMEAMGGVLFIDEAYALIPKESGGWDYGHEAIATLLKAMEDHRGEFCVILAGYKNEMINMMNTNPGFRSRIQFELEFPNYSREELHSITELMLEKQKYFMAEDAISKLLDILDVRRKNANFANAREVRNALDQIIMCQNVRCCDANDRVLTIADVNRYIRDAKISLPTSGDGTAKKVLTGEEELDQLVGLRSVKRMVKKIKAYAKRNREDQDFNLHMCFYGNPGTGKTEVARILSRILYDAGVLDESKLIETDAHGLLGRFVGETAPKTMEKINDAMNGVLFIDEAYALVGSGAMDGTKGYGEEAISVLLKEMEDHRGRFCVIMAGYQDKMQDLLAVNPGLKSRLQFTLEFPDYTREELGEIAVAFLTKKKYEIENDALDRVLDIMEYFRKQTDFANARTLRNILDQVIMNQNLRTEDVQNDNMIVLSDVEDYLSDEGIDLTAPNKGMRKIGFIAD